MVQSSFPAARGNGFHVAIITDGNSGSRRKRGMPRLVGHCAGTENVRRIVSTCPDLGVRDLTLYAFSTVGWRRPQPEVDGRMGILDELISASSMRNPILIIRTSGEYRLCSFPTWQAA